MLEGYVSNRHTEAFIKHMQHIKDDRQSWEQLARYVMYTYNLYKPK